MIKNNVNELSNDSITLFRNLAVMQGFSQNDIKTLLNSEINKIDELQNKLGFRTCDNLKCSEIFNIGYLTDSSYTFCSRECLEEIIPNIVEDDYFEKIILIDWEPEL